MATFKTDDETDDARAAREANAALHSIVFDANYFARFDFANCGKILPNGFIISVSVRRVDVALEAGGEADE
jgi:hypothetical protein